MILVSLKRIFRSGFLDFWRNSVVSFSSVFVLTVTLFVIGCLLFLQATLESTIAELRDKVDVNVYFIPNAGEADILAVKSQIEELPEVERVEYVTRDQALENFGENRSDFLTVLKSLTLIQKPQAGSMLEILAQETSGKPGENFEKEIRTLAARVKQILESEPLSEKSKEKNHGYFPFIFSKKFKKFLWPSGPRLPFCSKIKY